MTPQHSGSCNDTAEQSTRDTQRSNVLSSEIEISNGRLRRQGTQAKALRRGGQPIGFALRIVHEMTGGERRRQFCTIDFAGDRGDVALHFALYPVSQDLLKRVVLSRAVFPTRVFPAREPMVGREDHGFQRGASRMMALKRRILRGRK